MKELVYQVEFLSDIVLPASSNNEGNIQQLDFIPGSNFLGMVASKYPEFEDSFKVFHSGDVRFGDATILKDGKETYKTPLSFFHEKQNDSIVFNHHKIEDFSSFSQLKQKRDDYITKDLNIAQIEYNYSQKSAYNKEQRRSLDKSMYGYEAIKSGSTWQFSIRYKDISTNDLKLIQDTIIGKKRLGKSKSSQYGLVKIELKGIKEDIQNPKNSDETILYINSRLSLIDECGNPTYDLKYLYDGLKDENIVYKKSQIKSSTFTPYNIVRQTKDYERVCINKGSVIVLKDIDITSVPDGIGAYLSEGFGDILLNPEFLNQKKFSFKDETKDTQQNKKVEIKSDLAIFLRNRENEKKHKLNILNEADKFIADNKSLSSKKMNSQWGTIRSICSNSTNETIKVNVEHYITHGVAKTKWEGKNEKLLLEAISKASEPLKFTKLLSILIPKQKEEQADAK